MLPFLPLIASFLAPIAASVVGNIGQRANQDAMNAYNTPAQQMARFSAAGLNPNLIYSQGSAGNQPSAAQFMTPDVDPVKIWSAAVAARESRQRIRESRMREELGYVRSRGLMYRNAYDNLVQESRKPYLSENARYQSEIMKRQIQNMALEWGNKSTQGENLIKDSMIKDEMLRERRYYNTLRQHGVEKGDSPWYRMGSMLLRTHFPSLNQKLIRP